MKWLVSLVFTCAAATAAAPAPEPAQAPLVPLAAFHPVLLGLDGTVAATTETLMTAQQLSARLEDRYIRLRWFDETTPGRKAAGIAARVGKLMLWDRPQEHLFTVLTHEFAGHGGRYRELGISGVDYGIELPPPCGNGGGHATASVRGDCFSPHELTAIWIGGLESQQLLQQTLGLQWTASGRVSYRDASLYLESFQIGQDYIVGTKARLEPGEAENDLNAYIRLLNSHVGLTDPATFRLTLDGLKTRSRLNLANPLIAASLDTVIKNYLWDGERASGPCPRHRVVEPRERGP